jgi:TetR/AcrR family transcriptional repressor of mexJK operon
MPSAPKPAPVPDAPTCKARGRPKDHSLRDRILKAAREVFLEQGTSASVDKIAEKAATSRVTVYSHFPSKEALLLATLRQPVCNTLDPLFSGLDPQQPHAELLKVGVALLEMVTSDEIVAQTHMLYAWADKNPSFSRNFYDALPQAITHGLTAYLAQVTSLDVPDPGLAAEQFVGMVRGNEHLRAMLGIGVQHKGAQRDAWVASCVAIFLRGHARP